MSFSLSLSLSLSFSRSIILLLPQRQLDSNYMWTMWTRYALRVHMEARPLFPDAVLTVLSENRRCSL